MFKQQGYAAIQLIILAIGILGLGGWVANIVKIIGAGFDVFNGMLIARCIGVFVPPLGAVLGYF